ncbi:hypothetical protein XELAEV_18015184mg [Xenopus laevis]|uniref:Uncharacterized protein n=1 Tax=Xenopus laevis TaxID=8355 RepID=A0A974DK41_XENLA|nr:hypothetical protein XELAEV_18015184mg [Xenopus laevis]
MNCDSLRLEFLDIKIKKNQEGLVSTNLYQKKTCIEGIPKRQYLRLRRICSLNEDFKQEAYKLYQRFKMRGYKTRTLHQAYQWAVAQNREDLLHRNRPGKRKTSTNTNTQTRLIMSYNQNDRDPTLSKLVAPHPSFTYRRNTSIGDLLTHSHFQKQSRQTCCKMPGSYRCGSCEQCGHMKPFWARRHGYCQTHNYTGSYFQGIDRLHGDLRGGDLDNKLLHLETTWMFRLNTYKMEFGLNGHLNFQAFINK